MKKINIGYLCFLLPIFFSLFLHLEKENDFWFLLSHGRYVLSHGFPHVEVLAMHQGLSFVMQQWIFSILLYGIYSFFGDAGVFLFVFLVNIFIIFLLYKLCMIISHNKCFISCFIASLADYILLLETNFITTRPQIFSYLFLLIILYLLERFVQNSKDKGVYALPFISILFINFHASMWPLLFVFCMPFVVEFFILFLKYKDKRIFILLFNMFLSIIGGFLNPYGIEAMLYGFRSYGVDIINQLVGEMHSFSFSTIFFICNSLLIFIIFLSSLLLIRKKYKALPVHFYFLFFGLFYMAFSHIRNLSLFVIGVVPFFVFFDFDLTIKNKLISLKSFVFGFLFIIFIFSFNAFSGKYICGNRSIEDIVSYLDNHYDKDISIFSMSDYGGMLEYHYYKPYLDPRSEVFLKANNHKESILYEYYDVLNAKVNYSKFIEKYHFTHFIIPKKCSLSNYLLGQSNYYIAYQGQDSNMVLIIQK